MLKHAAFLLAWHNHSVFVYTMTVDVHLTYTWTSTSFISYILNSYRQTSALKFLQPKHGNANKNRGRHTATIAHLAVSALGTEKITSTMQKAPLRPWLCGWSFANLCKLTCMTELTLKRQRAGDNEVVPANEEELNVSRPLNSQTHVSLHDLTDTTNIESSDHCCVG